MPFARATRSACLALGTAALLVAAVPASADAYNHAWTYAAGPQFDTMEVFLTVDLPAWGAPTVGEACQNVFAVGQQSGYDLLSLFEPVKPGCSIIVELDLNPADEPALAFAVLRHNNEEVGIVDAAGVVRRDGQVVGQFMQWLEPVPMNAVGVPREILAAINAWAVELTNPNNLNPVAHAAAMAARYTADATLLPTIGIYDLYTNAAFNPAAPNAPIIANYFRFKFLPRKPIMAALNPATVHVVHDPNCNIATANGLYTFTLTHAKRNEPQIQVIQARFTFVFKKIDGVWKIVQHHSSRNPMDPSLRPAKLVCLPDVDGSGAVTWFDLRIVRKLKHDNQYDVFADLNGDGVVNQLDIDLVQAAMGQVCP